MHNPNFNRPPPPRIQASQSARQRRPSAVSMPQRYHFKVAGVHPRNLDRSFIGFGPAIGEKRFLQLPRRDLRQFLCQRHHRRVRKTRGHMLQLVDLLLGLRSHARIAMSHAHRHNPAEEIQILRDLHVFIDAKEIRHVTDDMAHGVGVPDHVMAQDAGRAGRRREERRQDAQGGGFAGAIGTDKTEEIARAFLVSTTTMAQRLVRAKKKIRDANIPYLIPETKDMPERLEAVLTVVYLVFNEGYVATRGTQLVRHDLCSEAIRLARLIVGLLEPRPASEAKALLALMLLHDARRDARLDEHSPGARLHPHRGHARRHGPLYRSPAPCRLCSLRLVAPSGCRG